ncbi:hypothetical protein SAMN04488029_0395 [Reichenbachiella faecimaris]|uniref:Uncharacterized protein n=1 Tax=Reichenbachiella faecimaris TaxID=692418 RepID=A0A1W2G5W7_REIFA|nr:hypothetical protein [Reichenbachiella faecimaris]SMD32057.1 hypothetical protein SAMN04488029_0395 [Reichenbachiella faecimaris]
MEDSDNKYQVGDSIYAKVAPDVELVVRRYIKRIYYCTLADHPETKDRVFFEREILNKGTQ